ncbi:ATP-binding protein [Pseudonocardia lacus]|uniref:ATP-binding protein n=1 Tax=Pseudonocardia lacus TaxID=2835865 RepID=UPI001BDC679A|nr:ATP-binding protein [Pseudonocardia lacus]
MDRAAAQGQPGSRPADRRSPAPGGPEPHADRLVLRLPATVEQLRPLRRRIDAWAPAHRLTDDELTDLQLALGEAVSNSIEHAYLAVEPGTVDVELAVRKTDDGREVVVAVTDRGRWKPASSRPTYRGRGITMIDGLSVGMRVTSNRSGTRVTFTVPLGD